MGGVEGLVQNRGSLECHLKQGSVRSEAPTSKKSMAPLSLRVFSSAACVKEKSIWQGCPELWMFLSRGCLEANRGQRSPDSRKPKTRRSQLCVLGRAEPGVDSDTWLSLPRKISPNISEDGASLSRATGSPRSRTNLELRAGSCKRHQATPRIPVVL